MTSFWAWTRASRVGFFSWSLASLGLLLVGVAGPGHLPLFFLDDPVELVEGLAHLAEPGHLHLEVEILGEQEVAEVVEFGQELADLGLGLGELGLFEELVRILHLAEDQLFARELEGQAEPRRVLGLEAPEGLGEPEHPLLELGHLGGGVLLSEVDRVPLERRADRLGRVDRLLGRGGFGLRGLGVGRLLDLLVIEDATGLLLLGRLVLGEGDEGWARRPSRGGPGGETKAPALESCLGGGATLGSGRSGLVIEDLLGAGLTSGFGRLEHLLLHLDHLGDLVDHVDEALPLRHLVENRPHLEDDFRLKLAGYLAALVRGRRGARQ